jgi:hypothetical protein
MLTLFYTFRHFQELFCTFLHLVLRVRSTGFGQPARSRTAQRYQSETGPETEGEMTKDNRT